MLLGAHVSPAGGPANAVARGVERDCTAIQIFNQSPRAWKGRLYTEEEAAAYHEALAASPVRSLVIHAIYLINCASEDPEIREKSLAALTLALRAGDQLGADGVVLHAGSAKTGDVGKAITRAGAVLREALAESDGCPLHLENTAGSGAHAGPVVHGARRAVRRGRAATTASACAWTPATSTRPATTSAPRRG